MKLRTRLTMAFVLLAVLPLAVAGAVLTHRNYDATLDMEIENGRREARLAASEVSSLVDGLVRELLLTVRVKGLDGLSAEDQRRLLAELMAWQNQFADLAYMDEDGEVRARVSLHRVVPAGMRENRADSPEFVAARASGSVWFGPIEIDADTAEPLMAVAVPTLDPRRGGIRGVLVARLRLKGMWDAVARLSNAGSHSISIADPSGLLVAHRNPSLVLRGERISLPREDGLHAGIGGKMVLSSRAVLVAGGREFAVVAERPLADALDLPIETAGLTLTILAGALAVALALVWLAGGIIVTPIRRLASVTTAIAGGDLTQRAEIGERGDEIGELANSFNAMTARLRDSLATLEAKVQERTQDLSEAQARLMEAIESISEGFVLCDAEDRFVLCNQKFRDFYPEVAHLIHPGRPFREVIEAAARLGLAEEATTTPDLWVRRRLSLRAAEMSHVQHLSSGRWLLISERRTAGGQMVGIYTDITDLKSSEEAQRTAKAQAEKADRAKSEFLAAMSHELRTPLNAIIGFSDTMLHGVFGRLENERYREYVRDIHQSGLHLLALINDILDLSKIEAGRMVLATHPVAPAPLIERAVSMMKEAAASAGLILATDLEPALPLVPGDERRLLQVLLNLLSNAVKFTPDGGRIEVRAHAEPGELIVEVADTGIGIAPADVPRALEVFGQVDSTRSRKYPGSGLGLPLSRQFVELHGGRLVIVSTPGRGTVVRVHLPLDPSPALEHAPGLPC